MFAKSTIDPLALMLLSCAATNMSAASTFDLLARVLLSSADPLAMEIFRDSGFRAKFDGLFSRKRRAREDRIKYEERYRGSEKAFVAAGAALDKHCQSLFSEGESCCSFRDCLDAFSETLKQKNSVLEGYIRVLVEETRIQEDITDCVARCTEALLGAWDAQERERVEKLKRWRNDAIWLFVTILPFFLAAALSFLVRR